MSTGSLLFRLACASKKTGHQKYRIDFCAPPYSRRPFDYPEAFELALIFYPHHPEYFEYFYNVYKGSSFQGLLLYDYVYKSEPFHSSGTNQFLNREANWEEEADDIQGITEMIQEAESDAKWGRLLDDDYADYFYYTEDEREDLDRIEEELERRRKESQLWPWED